MHFLHTTYPASTAFSLGSLSVEWYGILLAGALGIGLLITFYIAKKKQVLAQHFYNLFFLMVPAGILGGRIGHIIGSWDVYANDLSRVWRIWEGGTAIHGVLSGCIIVAVIYARRKNIRFWDITDTIVVALPLMQSIGRWGNYFNQELYGAPTELPWGIPIEPALRSQSVLDVSFFHPLFLYESVLMLLVFGIVLYVFNTTKLAPGRLTMLYFGMFAIVRFSLDFLRVDMLHIGPLLLTQWISLAICCAALYGWYKIGPITKNTAPAE